MTTTSPHSAEPLVRMVGISKSFGRVQALKAVDFTVGHREVVGLLGDNGAGKSTLIKILCGVYPPDQGEIFFEGRRVFLNSPKQARTLGIEAAYQDLALITLMSIARNFFLGREPTRLSSFLPFRLLNHSYMTQVTQQALEEIGISIRSPEEPVAILSGGERQSIAIGRAIHFGVKLLILDEPTSALSIKEAAKVLHYVRQAKERGLSVIFITHNLHHVYPVADRFVVLHRGIKVGDLRKEETSQQEIEHLIVTGQRIGEFVT